MFSWRNLTMISGVALLLVTGVKSQAGDGYVDKPDGYQFANKDASCTVKPSGVLSSLFFKDKKLFDSMQLFAIVKIGAEKKKIRLYQSNRKATLLQVNETPDKTSIICEGSLDSENDGTFASFKQILSLRADKIHIDNEIVTTKKIMVKPWLSFGTLIAAQIENFTETTAEVNDKNGNSSRIKIPAVYSKEQAAAWKGNLASCKFILDKMTVDFSMDGNTNTFLAVNDARSWDAEELSMLIKPLLKRVGDSDDIICPVGTKITWSFTITYK